MKLLLETEDSILGILLGLLLIGLSGKYFNLPKLYTIYGIFIAAYLVLTVIDIVHTFTDLGRHFVVIFFAVLSSLIDLILGYLIMAKFLGLKAITLPFIMPFLTKYIVPLLSTESGLFSIGLFFLITNVCWLIIWPITE